MNYNELINNLIDYGIDNHLITELDNIYISNLIIDLIKEKSFERLEKHDYPALPVILKGLCDIACEKGLIEATITDYDLFDTRIMGYLTPSPSVVYKNFLEQLKISYVYATDYFYDVSLKSNYIRKDRIDKNICYDFEIVGGSHCYDVRDARRENDRSISSFICWCTSGL